MQNKTSRRNVWTEIVDRGVVEIKSMIKKQCLDVAFWDCKSKRIVLYRKREKIDLADL